MATKPSALPLWASDTNFSTGPESGTPVKVEPSTGAKQQGWVPGQPWRGPRMNWWQNLVYQWTQYLDDLAAQNFAWTGTHSSVNEITYASAKTRTLTRAFGGVGPGDATGGQLEHGPLGNGSVYLRRVASSVLAPAWQEPLDLPVGAIITGWKTLVTTDTSSVGAGTVDFALYKRSVDFVTPAVGSETVVGTAGTHSGTNALTAVTKTGLSETVVAGTQYFLRGLQAGSSGSDLFFQLHGYEITFTETRATGHY